MVKEHRDSLYCRMPFHLFILDLIAASKEQFFHAAFFYIIFNFHILSSSVNQLLRCASRPFPDSVQKTSSLRTQALLNHLPAAAFRTHSANFPGGSPSGNNRARILLRILVDTRRKETPTPRRYRPTGLIFRYGRKKISAVSLSSGGYFSLSLTLPFSCSRYTSRIDFRC